MDRYKMLFDRKSLSSLICFCRFAWSDCLFVDWLAGWLLVYVKCVFRCKFNLKCFSIAVTCNIFLLIIWQSCVCVLVSFSSFVFASYIISRFMGVWKLYCLSGWAGCLSFIQFTGFSKIFVRQTTHYVPSNICLLLSFSLLLSLLCISMYKCTINEYLYRDRCNNRLYLMLLYCVCKSLLFYLIRLFVCFIVLEWVCLSMCDDWI